MSAGHAEEALLLLQNHRLNQHDPAPPSASGRSFTYEEVNHVLGQVLERDPPDVGLVRALLAMGADVNYARRGESSVWKKMVGRQRRARRAGFLQKAAARAPPEVVAALAAHADQRTLDAAVAHAGLRGDAAVARVLLDHGADPEGLGPELRRRAGLEAGGSAPGDDGWAAAGSSGTRVHDAWHQEQLDRVMARRGYRSMENLGAAARADQERLRLKIAELQCKKLRASTTRSQSSDQGDGQAEDTTGQGALSEGGGTSAQ